PREAQTFHVRRVRMPGPAFHLEVLNLAIKRLSTGSAADRAKAKILTDHPNHARFGALGPDFLRYRPVPTEALDTLINTPDLSTLSSAEKTTLAKQVEPNPEMALYGVLYRMLVPHFADMQAIDDTLSKVAGIAAAEDINGLKSVKSEVDGLKPKIDALKDL